MNTTMIILGAYYGLCLKLGLWVGVAFSERSRRQDEDALIRARAALARVHQRIAR